MHTGCLLIDFAPQLTMRYRDQSVALLSSCCVSLKARLQCTQQTRIDTLAVTIYPACEGANVFTAPHLHC